MLKKIKFQIDYPRGDSPCAVLVIAPGARYDMDRTIFKLMAQFLMTNGVVVARFNWDFYLNDPINGQPSETLDNESREVQDLIDFLRKDARVDVSNMFILGKSFGSVVAWKTFSNVTSLRGAILLTPLCNEVAKHYPNCRSESRPVLLIAGDLDPHAKLESLNKLAATLKNDAHIYVVPGNHGLEDKYGKDISEHQQAADYFEQRITGINQVILSWLRTNFV